MSLSLKSLIVFLTLISSRALASEEAHGSSGGSGEVFSTYKTTNCHTCKSKHPTGYFCNEADKTGYCCYAGSDQEPCQASKAANRVCSNNAPSNFYYGACFGAAGEVAEERCGGHTEIDMSTSEHTIAIGNIPWAEGTACVWTFSNKAENRYPYFDGGKFLFRINQNQNFDLVFATGHDLNRAHVDYSTIDKNWPTNNNADWIEFKKEAEVFFAAIPKSNQTTNYLRFTFKQVDPPVKVTISEEADELLFKIQIGITAGGITLAAIVMIFACFVRRFQRWQELQRIVVTEDEDYNESSHDISGRYMESQKNSPRSKVQYQKVNLDGTSKHKGVSGTATPNHHSNPTSSRKK